MLLQFFSFFSFPTTRCPSLSLKMPPPQSLDGHNHWPVAFQRLQIQTTFTIPQDKMCLLHAKKTRKECSSSHSVIIPFHINLQRVLLALHERLSRRCWCGEDRGLIWELWPSLGCQNQTQIWHVCWLICSPLGVKAFTAE